MSRPADCPQCEARFMRDGLLQAELRHLAAIYGPRMAESELNERYGERHDEYHGREDDQ